MPEIHDVESQTAAAGGQPAPKPAPKPATEAPQTPEAKQPSGGVVAVALVLGQIIGFVLAIVLFLKFGVEDYSDSVGEAFERVVPYASFWLAFVVAIDQILKITCGAAVTDTEVAQAKVYLSWRATWVSIWPAFTAGAAMGYFGSILASVQPWPLFASAGALLAFALCLVVAAWKASPNETQQALKFKAQGQLFILVGLLAPAAVLALCLLLMP